MAVYIDVLFLRELLVDGAVLMTTAWVRNIRPNPWRLLASASFGACYVVLMLFPQLSFMFTLIVKVLFSLLMLWIAFGFRTLQHFASLTAAFYCVNFVAAGAIMGLYYLSMQGSGEMWRTITTASGGLQAEFRMGLFYLGGTFLIGLFLFRAVVKGRRAKELVLQHLAEVTVTIGSASCTCQGLIDTGNQLYDPLTRTPVMVMEASKWESQLPPAWLKGIREAQVDRLIAGMGSEPFEWQDRLRLVPFRGINRGSQFMLAVKPDSVEVNRDGQVYETSKVLIGLDGGKLAADGAYQAIIHPSMVQP